MKKLLLLVLLLVAFLLFFYESGSAATIEATSCSNAHIQAAIDSASSGDTINVPAGTCAWDGDVRVSSDKALIFIGNGIGSTVVSSSGEQRDFKLADSGSEVTGFTFNGVLVKLYLGKARIHHNRFYRSTEDPGYRADVQTSSSTRTDYKAPSALIDNNQFVNGKVLIGGGLKMANTEWTLPLALGDKYTDDNVAYIEDNTFEKTREDGAGNFVDADYAGAYVFRYNTVTGDGHWQSAMFHAARGGNRGGRFWEFYGNSIDTEYSGTADVPFFLRAGTGIAFDNIVTGNWDDPIIGLENERSYYDTGSEGLCDGDSNWDGNEDSSGYPCRDQIGRGPDPVLWEPGDVYAQPLMPAYAWDNLYNAVNMPFGLKGSTSGDHIKENRDYYNYTSSFDGTSGVGAGVFADRPSSCTTDVAYWATDAGGDWNKTNTDVNDGTLYKCITTDTWTEYYTPYTYPHPLRGVGLITASNINSGGLTISNIGSGNLTISNIGD